MPKVLKILTLPKENKRLRKKSILIPVKDLSSPLFKRLVSDMIRTMQVKDGAGLAAPQVGQNIRLVIVNTKEGPVSMVNPELVKKSLAKETAEEGCLSIPGYFGAVKRHKSLVCAYLDLDGVMRKLEGNGLLARAIQHELDHLDGLLFIDKMEPIKKK
jgi:peptide deformylase